MRIDSVSVDGVIIYFGDKIDEEVLKTVSNHYKTLKALNHPHLISIIPSYTSIYIRYDIFEFDQESIKKFILDTLKQNSKSKTQNSKLITIPAYYDISVGYDLKKIADEKNISINDVIKLHSQKSYLVYAIGFIPGFAYLAKVDNKIATPRLSHPRDKIPKGSVAIADTQTAVYPKDSPGGWNIIARTPIELFDPSSKNLTPFEIGDRVRFEPISKKEFLKLGGCI